MLTARQDNGESSEQGMDVRVSSAKRIMRMVFWGMSCAMLSLFFFTHWRAVHFSAGFLSGQINPNLIEFVWAYPDVSGWSIELQQPADVKKFGYYVGVWPNWKTVMGSWRLLDVPTWVVGTMWILLSGLILRLTRRPTPRGFEVIAKRKQESSHE